MKDKIQYCEMVLPKVSRTFAPTIRRLPKGLRLQVTVAYLLCRIADTIEDSAALTIEQKKEMLTLYAEIFARENSNAFKELLQKLTILPEQTPDEQLTHNLPLVMDVFYTFSPNMRKHIAHWVAEMSLGMRKYAQAKQKRRFTFLKSMKDLDEYTYYVAGTVGYLLTELFSFYSKKITPVIKSRLVQLAESFGKGLQLVNIIRDAAADLRRGQSYIPDELLQRYQLTRENIFHQENADRAQKLFNELIRDAVQHLDKALDYTLTIPKEETRIRLFCILPLFWALRTLELLQRNTLALLGSEKIKISKRMLHKEFILALINVNSNHLLRWHYRRIRQDIDRPLLNTQ